jgi:hypothetical protein
VTDVTSPLYLGPLTEARFESAFSCGATITAKAAADLLGVDVRTLGDMTDEGVVRAVPRGKLRAYTERDLRAYLAEGTAECRPSTTRPKVSAPRPGGKVLPFTQRSGRADPQRKRPAARK